MIIRQTWFIIVRELNLSIEQQLSDNDMNVREYRVITTLLNTKWRFFLMRHQSLLETKFKFNL